MILLLGIVIAGLLALLAISAALAVIGFLGIGIAAFFIGIVRYARRPRLFITDITSAIATHRYGR